MKHLLLKTCLMLCLLLVGVGTTWAAEGDEHDFTQSLSQLLNNSASISSIEIPAQTYSVKEVKVTWSHNKNITNAVTIAVSVGSTSYGSANVTNGSSQVASFKTTPQSSNKGAVTISFTNNCGSGTGKGTFSVSKVTLVEGEPAASHKAYFYSNGALLNENGTTFGEGDAIIFPSDPSEDGVTFMGWTKTQNYSSANTAPSDMTKSATMGDADVNYYAVFATQEGDGETWSRITSLSQLEDGKYIIINGGYYLPSTTTGSTTTPTAVTAPTITNGVITGTVEDAMIWNFTAYQKNNYQYYIKNSDSPSPSFLYEIDDNNGLRVGSTPDYWTFEENTTEYFALKGNNKNRYCAKYNSGTNWRSYASAGHINYANQGKIELYKLTSNTTYSDYCTTLATQYDVKFYVGGEEQTGLAQKVVEGGNPSTVTEPTKTGYTFDGWYEASDFSGDKIADVTSVTISADKNFYGRFNINNYTITYNNVEGATHSNPASYTIETATINLADASKEGFIFQGWYDNEGLTGDAVTTIAQGSTGNKTFWAKWAEVPANPSTVTFYVGEHGTCDVTEITESEVGAGVSLPSVTANEGWVFKGWSTENPATAETIVSAGDDGMYHILANTALYAYYKVKPATPTFSSETGAIEKGTEVTISCTTEGATIHYTTTGDEPTAESAAFSEAIAVNAEQTIKAIAILDGEQSEVASAAYTIATHTAQFSINGVITEANNCTAAKGEAVVFPADPEVDGVVFMGWATETIDGTQDDAPVMYKSATMGTGDITYYAVFATETGTPETHNIITYETENFPASYAAAADYTLNGVSFNITQAYVNGQKTQWRANGNSNGTGAIYNNDAMSISKITLTYDNSDNYKNFTIKVGNSVNPTSGTEITGVVDANDNKVYVFDCSSENASYFVLTNGTNAGYLTSIDITCGGTTYSDYCTAVSVKATPTLSFANPTYHATMGEGFTAPVLNNTHSVDVTYSSSETGVATVNATTGVVELVAAGTTIITAAFDGNENYNAASASYELVVAAARDAHTARFSVNGSVNEALNSTVSEGAHITFPSDPESQYGLTFMGWTSVEIEGALADAPSMVDVENEPMGSADITYYAVFAKQSGNDSDYQLVESALDDWTGDYLIVYNNTYAMNTHSGNQNANTFATYTDISEYYTEAEKSIVSNATTDALVYRAAATTKGYSLYSVSDESYLGITANTTSNGSKLRWNTSYTESADDWTLGVGSIGNVGSNTLYIRWNNNSGSYRFAAYASNGQQAIQLFKKNEVTYTDYCTSFITFDEANTTIEEVFDTYGRVEVTRAIKADTWNTFCVPFDMTAEQIAENFGENAEVKKLDTENLDVNGSSYNMHFVNAESIEAGKPYMVKVSKEKTSIVVRNAYVLTKVDGEEYYDNSTATSGIQSLTFQGNYTRQLAPRNSFIISSNKFYFVDSDVNLKGFRGYITTSEGAQVQALFFSFDDGIVTGISTNIDAEQSGRIYNLQGLQQSKLQRGVNIVNGRKVIK